MKRPFVESFPDADDIFDPSESGGKITSYPGKAASPFHAPSDSDYLSDDSKKTRKKRSAYQKIADDVRMKLLECVKNGETLKSAAKRFKINYSSAKSILHTFRKEGRILKKSAQERTTKKKINAENEHPHKPQKHLKKETPRKVQRLEDSIVVGKSANESNPLNSRKNSNCASRAADFFESHHDQKTAPVRKGSAFFNKTHQEEAKSREDFYHHHQTYETTTHQEAPMHSNFMFFSQNETFPDMTTSAFYNRNMTNDEFAFDPNSFLFSKTADMQFLLDDKMRDGGVYEQHEGYDVKNYMDHQNVYRTALRKASFFSSTSNGMRKNSFDMY